VEKTIFWLFLRQYLENCRDPTTSRVTSASPAELWSSVNGKQKTYNRIEINGVQLNADFINMFFADIATDPYYDALKISNDRGCI